MLYCGYLDYFSDRVAPASYSSLQQQPAATAAATAPAPGLQNNSTLVISPRMTRSRKKGRQHHLRLLLIAARSNRWTGRPLPHHLLQRSAGLHHSFKPSLRKDPNSSTPGALGAATVVQVHLRKVPGWLPWPRLQDVLCLLQQGYCILAAYPRASNETACGNAWSRVVGPAVTLSRTIFGELRGKAGPQNL